MFVISFAADQADYKSYKQVATVLEKLSSAVRAAKHVKASAFW